MNGLEGFTIRRASTEDVDTLMSHRRETFRDMGYNDDAALESMSAKFLSWLLNKIKASEHIAWFVLAANGSVAAGAGLWLMDFSNRTTMQDGPSCRHDIPPVPRDTHGQYVCFRFHRFECVARPYIRPNTNNSNVPGTISGGVCGCAG
jgi:hypothetical protein